MGSSPTKGTILLRNICRYEKSSYLCIKFFETAVVAELDAIYGLGIAGNVCTFGEDNVADYWKLLV